MEIWLFSALFRLTSPQIDDLDNRDRSVNTLVNQLLRSSTSIGANIIEAQAGRTKRDFTNFLTHALKSANETKYWLGLLRDARKITNPTDRSSARCIERIFPPTRRS